MFLGVWMCVCVWVGGTVETWLYLSSTAPVRMNISTNFRRLNYRKARQHFTGKSSHSSVNIGVTVKHTQPWTGNFNRNWNWKCHWWLWRKGLSVPVVLELYRLNKHPASVSFFSFFTTVSVNVIQASATVGHLWRPTSPKCHLEWGQCGDIREATATESSFNVDMRIWSKQTRKST